MHHIIKKKLWLQVDLLHATLVKFAISVVVAASVSPMEVKARLSSNIETSTMKVWQDKELDSLEHKIIQSTWDNMVISMLSKALEPRAMAWKKSWKWEPNSWSTSSSLSLLEIKLMPIALETAPMSVAVINGKTSAAQQLNCTIKDQIPNPSNTSASIRTLLPQISRSNWTTSISQSNVKECKQCFKLHGMVRELSRLHHLHF